jgi:hypothetical protein
MRGNLEKKAVLDCGVPRYNTSFPASTAPRQLLQNFKTLPHTYENISELVPDVVDGKTTLQCCVASVQTGPFFETLEQIGIFATLSAFIRCIIV